MIAIYLTLNILCNNCNFSALFLVLPMVPAMQNIPCHLSYPIYLVLMALRWEKHVML